MIYRLTIKGWSGGLNELLNGVRYDYKLRKVVNHVKSDYEKKCMDAIRFFSGDLRGKTIKGPVVIHYRVFAKDMRHDRMNMGSAIDKAFCDALQKCGKLKNDGWNDVLGATFDYAIDRNNPRVEIAIQEVTEEPDHWEGWDNGKNKKDQD